MKYIKIVIVIIITFTQVSVFAQKQEDIKKSIAEIKRNSNYLYADATASTTTDAKEIATARLKEEIDNWIKQQYQNERRNIVINSLQHIWEEYSLPRGNMYRCFIYVNKGDVVSLKTARSSDNTHDGSKSKTEQGQKNTIVLDLPMVIKTLLPLTEYKIFMTRLLKFQDEKLVKGVNRYANLDDVEQYYLVIYNKQGKILAILSPGSNRTNVSSNESDSEVNYPGCGAIGFKLE